MSGFGCLVEGFALVRQPGMRRYVVVPGLINAIVLIVLVTFSVREFEYWVDAIVGLLPDWLSFLSWLVWIVGVVIAAFALLYVFTIIANLIASPFNAVLATKIEERLSGGSSTPSISLWLVIPKAVMREVSKFLYLLPRLVGLLVISVIPIINAGAPVLWLLFGAWMMAIQYCDYAADNNDVSFAALRTRLEKKRVQAVLFGLPVYLLLAIPLINLILIPIAVAGGTVFWVRNLSQSA